MPDPGESTRSPLAHPGTRRQQGPSGPDDPALHSGLTRSWSVRPAHIAHRADGIVPARSSATTSRVAGPGSVRLKSQCPVGGPVDDIVPFKPLTEREIERIVDLMFDDVRSRLADRRMTVELTDAATRHIAEQGYDPVYGARPRHRYISHEVETRVGRALFAGDVEDGATITITETDGELSVDFRNPRRAQ